MKYIVHATLYLEADSAEIASEYADSILSNNHTDGLNFDNLSYLYNYAVDDYVRRVRTKRKHREIA